MALQRENALAPLSPKNDESVGAVLHRDIHSIPVEFNAPKLDSALVGRTGSDLRWGC